MKNLSVLALTFMICTSVFAQKKVGGFYKGTLYNDSTKMVQQYELALAEYRGKIMGYSYVTFVVNDTFYYGIRKIKAKIIGDSLIVEDDKMIANNFPESPAKHVNRTVTIPFNGQDSLVTIDGRWTTNKTKFYYAVPGAVEASKSSDSSRSTLFAHLKELNLMPNDNYAATESIVETKTKQKDQVTTTKIENQPAVVQTKGTSEQKSVVINTKTQENPIASETKEKSKKDKSDFGSNRESNSSKTADTKHTAPPAITYTQRKERVQQAVDITSDSLQLSFYDNGVVDGDSISVYLNDQPIITNSKLTSVATKQKIYVGGMTEIRLLLVAENLGSIPPNTGLLIIRDGDKTYQVNFTADMQTNASILLKRKTSSK
jgi:hypothetical protein